MSIEEHFSYTLLDNEENVIGPLDGISEGGEIKRSIFTTIRTGGQITYTGPALDWLLYRVKITLIRTYDDGTQWIEPLGLFIPGNAQKSHVDGYVSTPLELYDKLLILHEDAIEQTLTVPESAYVEDSVRAIIAATGETNVWIEPSGVLLRNALVFEAGTSRLEIVNTVLEAGGYMAVYCDGNGQYRAEVSRAPQSRPEAHRFVAGANSMHLATFDREQDFFTVPNKLILISRTDGDVPALVSTRTLDQLAPESPLTRANRGRWVTQVEHDVEAASQAILDSICERRLLSSANVGQQVVIAHAHLPVYLNNRVFFSNDTSGELVELSATITKQDFVLTPGELVTSTLRGIV